MKKSDFYRELRAHLILTHDCALGDTELDKILLIAKKLNNKRPEVFEMEDWDKKTEIV